MNGETGEKLEDIRKRFLLIKEQAGISGKKKIISGIEGRMNLPGFWQDSKKAQDEGRKLSVLKREVSSLETLEREIEDSAVLCELAAQEEDEGLEKEMGRAMKELEEKIGELELRMFLGGEFDPNNAILELHAGAGGTESCDWAEMLLRMYSRWVQKKGFGWKPLSVLPGDEAGIKSVTVLVSGEYAYGHLRTESGVHRLVRISPFDSQSRRHTSFCSVYVIPEVDQDPEVEVKESDLKIETFRAGGHGGQHVNTTDSAVRITHVPTGITAQCQNERSQHQNRENAMKVLLSRLYSYYKEEKEKELMEERGQKSEIGWGSQIRSYVLHPYSMVKDHRTGVETGNVQAVMDGEIDGFINAFLSSSGK